MDLLARLGGDEFAMLLPQTSRAGKAARVAANCWLGLITHLVALLEGVSLR